MSLHTRYRPQTLTDVLGQDHVTRSLEKVLADGRAHSFIFVGFAGVGKTSTARIVANTVAGPDAGPASIIEIDAATTSGVDAVRAISNAANFRAVGGSPVKTIILDEAHRLSAAAWAALLKPIEEPPKHVFWCLCTTEAGKIPKTIETRCLKYVLKPVSEELLCKLVRHVAKLESIEVNPDVLEAIAEAALGSPRQALVYLEACAHAESVAEARTIMRSAGQTKEVIDLCRFILEPRGGWVEAVKIIKALDAEPESIRIQIVNYLAAVLLNTNSDKRARHLLVLLDAFGEEYRQSERQAPLLRSVALALGMDQ